MCERLGKALFLLSQDRPDGLSSRSQLRIGIAHFAIECIDQGMKKQALGSELMAVAHGAAGDPAQHIAAPFVTWDHPIDDQKRTSPNMVSDDSQARRCEISGPRGLARRCNQGLKEIDFII